MSAKPNQSLGDNVNHLSRLMTQALGEAIAAHGVSPGQLPVLKCLWEHDGLTQRELYERVHIEQATMSNTLSRMERDGLVKRKPDPKDRRAQRVMLTAKANKLEASLADAALAVNKQAFGNLKKKDKKALMDLMHTMIKNLTPPDN
jgi:DNA-binding MarR family transcriptional regulator